MVAVALLLVGAAIGFGKPVSIALVAGGLLLLILEQTLKHLRRKPAHRAVDSKCDARQPGTDPAPRACWHVCLVTHVVIRSTGAVAGRRNER